MIVIVDMGSCLVRDSHGSSVHGLSAVKVPIPANQRLPEELHIYTDDLALADPSSRLSAS